MCGAVHDDSPVALASSVIAREGRYDAIELLAWRGNATAVAWEDPDVTSLSINSEQNKISISVSRDEAVTRVVRRVVAAGVPPGALLLEIQGPAQPL